MGDGGGHGQHGGWGSMRVGQHEDGVAWGRGGAAWGWGSMEGGQHRGWGSMWEDEVWVAALGCCGGLGSVTQND